MSRYFFSERSNRPTLVNGRTYRFDSVSFTGGNYQGVLEATTPEAEADMSLAVQQRLGVTEIPRADFDILKKKLRPTPSSAPSSGSTEQQRHTGTRPLPISLSKTGAQGAERAPSETPPTASESPASVLLPPGEFIRIERVSPPEMFIEEEKRVGNAVEKTPKKPRKSK
jgi:hypothetical protein